MTDKERRGWYGFAFASEPISAVVISGFMPLLVQEAALGAAGFPAVCPNVTRDPSLLGALFNATGAAPLAAGTPAAAYFFGGEANAAFWPSASCVAGGAASADGLVYCPGLPGDAGYCLAAGGGASLSSPFALSVSANGTNWEPSAFVAAMVAIATALQMLVFVSIGSFADYGSLRKTILCGLSACCIVFSLCALAVDVGNWWAGGLLFVLVTVAYGTTFVQYNAWLPLISANDPATLAADDGTPAGAARARTVFFERMDHISNRGYGAGYCGAITALVICVGITLASATSIGAYRASVALAGVWFLAFGAIPYYWILPRPGPPLPAGANYLTLPWANLFRTCGRLRELPETFKLLACWWLFSDGMNVIGNVGAQYANAYVDWRPLPKGLGLAALLLITPIFAALGTIFWPWCARRFNLKPQHVIAMNCVGCALVPAYGLLGFASPYLGFRKAWDMFLGVIVYGFQIGSLQSYARAAYAGMLPEGLEAQFFGLYSFTDKGSSWIGPAVVSGVLQSTGNFRLAFVFPIVVLLPPVALLLMIDYGRGAADARDYAARHNTAGGVASRGALSTRAVSAEVGGTATELFADALKGKVAAGGGAAETAGLLVVASPDSAPAAAPGAGAV